MYGLIVDAGPAVYLMRIEVTGGGPNLGRFDSATKYSGITSTFQYSGNSLNFGLFKTDAFYFVGKVT